MTPTAADYFEKAQRDLDEARKIFSIGLAAVAARSAYYAAFHADEALIFERTGKIAKTHAGVRAEFARLTKTGPEEARALPTFLAKAYAYKGISDYGVGRDAVITMAQAQEALENAARFIK